MKAKMHMVHSAHNFQRLANQRRADAVTMIHYAGTGHTGGAMSCLDILCVLHYGVMRLRPNEPDWPERDRFLLSKGHSVEGYYAILADLGFFPKTELAAFSKAGSRLIGHPNNKVPGVEMSTGSLGHGLPVGVGMALGAKRTGQDWRTYVLMGDGELAEGSIWEAAMAGAHYGLDNLYAIIDRNGLQISGGTEEVMAHGDLVSKWRAFGWDTTEMDGHDIPAMLAYFNAEHMTGKPHCLIAHTIKGKGLPFAENKPEWHHKVPTAEQLKAAYAALGVEGVDWL
jgi:transketolase